MHTADDLSDGSGNRVAMVTTVSGTSTLTAYIGSIEEVQTTSSSTTTTTYYTVGGLRIAAKVNSSFSSFGSDALGSQVVVLNTSGSVIGAHLYGPYGNSRDTTGTLPTSIGFTGQRADSVSGLDYYNARYYDPTVGVFLSADVKQGNTQGMDPYAYVAGNPETQTDPSGQAFIGGGSGALVPTPSSPHKSQLSKLAPTLATAVKKTISQKRPTTSSVLPKSRVATSKPTIKSQHTQELLLPNEIPEPVGSINLTITQGPLDLTTDLVSLFVTLTAQFYVPVSLVEGYIALLQLKSWATSMGQKPTPAVSSAFTMQLGFLELSSETSFQTGYKYTQTVATLQNTKYLF